jgi:CelD/BcsL family acetyltransferase involved in cellulose biosynthesis
VNVELKVIRCESELTQIHGQWNALLRKTGTRPLPLTQEWLLAWWSVFHDQNALEIRCLFRDDQLIGFAPFFRRQANYRWVPVEILELAANGHSPYSAVVLDPAMDDSDRSRCLEILCRVAPNQIGVFFKLEKGSACCRYIQERSEAGVISAGEKPGMCTPVIAIDRPWTEFWAARERKLKKSLNHKLNRFHRSPSLSVTSLPMASSADPVFQEMVEVSGKSWKVEVGNDLRTSAHGRTFLANLIDALGPSGAVTAWLVRDGDKPVAYELHLCVDGVVYPIRADYDRAYREVSPGSVLEYTALKSLFDNGSASEYYTCADDYWYLSNWTSCYRQFCTLEVFGSGWKTRSLYWLEYRVIPLIKRVIRKPDRRIILTKEAG